MAWGYPAYVGVMLVTTELYEGGSCACIGICKLRNKIDSYHSMLFVRL